MLRENWEEGNNMDKKNTILLTVIAVATLLVAVVGATFAYYSVEHLDSTSLINVNAQADPVGAITLYSPNTLLGMTITPTDMASDFTQKKFYALVYQSGGIPADASKNEADSSITNGVYAISRKNHVMTKADLVGGNAETAYTCTSQLKVTLDKSEGSMGAVLHAGDAILYFTTDQVTMQRPNGDYQDNQTLDLHDLTLLEGTNPSITYNLIYKVNGLNADSRVAEVKADLEITNKTGEDQRYLAGADQGIIDNREPGVNTAGSGTKSAKLTVSLDTIAFNCTIDAKKAVNPS